MSDFRQVPADFSVAPQITTQDVERAAAMGFVLLINNRPDGEASDQTSGAEIERAARKAGLEYLCIPVVGAPTHDQIEAQRQAVAGADGPVLAYCRSGTRSISTWALGQAASGATPRGELARLGAEAGYDLRPLLGI